MLKLKLLPTLLVLFLVVGSCTKSDTETELRIDLGVHFDNDFVTINIDNNEIFADTISTNYVLSLAKSFNSNQLVGYRDISISVNNTQIKDRFRHKEGRFIYVRFDRDLDKITIEYPNEPYFYD